MSKESVLRRSICAVIPVKSFKGAKTRLTGFISDESREMLARAMFKRVLEAVKGSKVLEKTFIVTSDPEVAGLSREAGCEVVHDWRSSGQSDAVRQAVQIIHSMGKKSMLTFPADLPLLTSEDIDSLCNMQPEAPGVVIVPAANDGGTNAILCTPPACLDFHFGEKSYQKHISEARYRCLSIESVHPTGFSLDIDRPDDLVEFLDQEKGMEEFDFLSSLDVPSLLKVR